MKNLFLPLLTLIIGFAAGYYFCNSRSHQAAQGAMSSMSADAIYPSENSISYDEAKMMVDTFGMYGMQDANHRAGGRGLRTRSIFMPLSKLDSLTAALDAARKKDGKTDGLRIYFGRYPKLQLDKKAYPHPFMNTIIFVSTRLTKVLQKGALDSISIHLDYYGAPNKSRALKMMADDPQNRAELCPDACSGATLVCPDPTDPSCNGSSSN